MRGCSALLARLQLVGTVVSEPTHMHRTAKVLVSRLVRHPIVEKEVRQRKLYLAHDEESARMPGDVVRIELCRPLSKRKHFKIVEVVREAERLEHPRTGKIVTKATL